MPAFSHDVSDTVFCEAIADDTTLVILRLNSILRPAVSSLPTGWVWLQEGIVGAPLTEAGRGVLRKDEADANGNKVQQDRGRVSLSLNDPLA